MRGGSAPADGRCWSKSSWGARRRATYSTIANAASVSTSAAEYHTVRRPRIVCMSRLHDVAHAAHGVNQLRLARVIDLLAEPRDHDVHDVRPGIEVVVPGVLRDQGARHDAARMPHQVLEHGIFLGRQVDELAAQRSEEHTSELQPQS